MKPEHNVVLVSNNAWFMT